MDFDSIFIYLFIEGYTYNPINHTGSPQGLSQVQISHKLNIIQNKHIIIYINVKRNPKVSPLGALVYTEASEKGKFKVVLFLVSSYLLGVVRVLYV